MMIRDASREKKTAVLSLKICKDTFGEKKSFPYLLSCNADESVVHGAYRHLKAGDIRLARFNQGQGV